MGRRVFNSFERNQIFNKINEIDNELQEEANKEDDKRNKEREFELMYAKFIAGLKLNTGARIF